jgi:hypothetical protein
VIYWDEEYDMYSGCFSDPYIGLDNFPLLFAGFIGCEWTFEKVGIYTHEHDWHFDERRHGFHHCPP